MCEQSCQPGQYALSPCMPACLTCISDFHNRIAHRLRDIQKLPYVVVANPHLSLVYELYYKAFERFRVVPEIKTLEDNERFCDVLRKTLKEHLVVIPKLAMGVLECRDLVAPGVMDQFMNTLLRSVWEFDTSGFLPLFLCEWLICSRLLENFPSSHCRAALGLDRNFQLSMALPRLAGPD
jgi:hypothetical protein